MIGFVREFSEKNLEKIFRGILLAIFAGAGCGAGTQPAAAPEPEAAAEAPSGAFSAEPYAAALGAHVDAKGFVDYTALKAERKDLDAFVGMLGAVDAESFESWSEADKIAFWINAYNAITLRVIVDHYPIKSSFGKSLVFPKSSIRQVDGAWDELRFAVLGAEMTLNEIEHETLRAKFNEPRIHMALVCAAASCPPLRAEPFDGAGLDEQLEDQTRRFLQDESRFKIDQDKKRVYLSEIFDWFGEDFEESYGTKSKFSAQPSERRAALNFIARHLDEDGQAFLESGEYKIELLDYDWLLNEQ